MSAAFGWQGLDKIQQRYSNAPAIVEEELDDAADTILAYGIQALSTYPPPRPRQTYTRTFNLQKGWRQPARKFRIGRAGVGVMLRNPESYSLLVHGDAQGRGQARIHQGRWPSLQATQQRINTQIGPRAMQRAIARIGQRLGGR